MRAGLFLWLSLLRISPEAFFLFFGFRFVLLVFSQQAVGSIQCVRLAAQKHSPADINAANADVRLEPLLIFLCQAWEQ